ncbi:hypothetical protein F4809DRAFT_643646 [Biscogniauxia mediterranea]|nr:hypothetical protein F4809DRAFT_643646 [Biscogniauxia mediterranea]
MKQAILAIILGLSLQVLGLPGNPSSSSSSSLSFHSGFTRTPTTISSSSSSPSSAAVAELFSSPFTASDKQTFVCQVDTIEPTVQWTQYADCQQLMQDLLGTPGFWACEDWVPGRYYPLVEHGSCQFRVSRSDATDLAIIGNGDVYATLMLALDMATQNGTVTTLGFYGTNICGPAPAAAHVDFAI